MSPIAHLAVGFAMKRTGVNVPLANTSAPRCTTAKKSAMRKKGL